MIYDAGFMTAPFLSQFRLMLNLKNDQVTAGVLPPVQPTRRTLEVRWREFQLMVWERWWPERFDCSAGDSLTFHIRLRYTGTHTV